jgi:hypothetical protein
MIGVEYFRHGSHSQAAVLSTLGMRGLVLAGMFVVGRYLKRYETRCGEVQSRGEPIRHQEALTLYSSGAPSRTSATSQGFDIRSFPRPPLLTLGLCLGAYAALRVVGPTVSVYAPEISERLFFGTVQQMVDIVCGVIFLTIWIWRGCRLSQSYYLVLGLVMLALPALGATLGFVLPAVSGDPERIRMLNRLLPLLYDLNFGQLVCGVSGVLAGLLDHLQLVRALGRPTAAEPA